MSGRKDNTSKDNLLRQWAAVTAHLSFSRVAPQKGEPVALLNSKICQGIDPCVALFPPIVFARVCKAAFPQARNKITTCYTLVIKIVIRREYFEQVTMYLLTYLFLSYCQVHRRMNLASNIAGFTRVQASVIHQNRKYVPITCHPVLICSGWMTQWFAVLVPRDRSSVRWAFEGHAVRQVSGLVARQSGKHWQS